jgi:DNA-binding response OmpR family regulator
MLGKRIKKSLPLVFTNSQLATRNPQPETCNLPPESCNLQPETCNPQPVTILEISLLRPDRIIFMGKKIELTTKEFSLIHLLAQHNRQVMSYEDIIKKLWGAETEAIYTRIKKIF